MSKRLCRKDNTNINQIAAIVIINIIEFVEDLLIPCGHSNAVKIVYGSGFHAHTNKSVTSGKVVYIFVLGSLQ